MSKSTIWFLLKKRTVLTSSVTPTGVKKLSSIKVELLGIFFGFDWKPTAKKVQTTCYTQEKGLIRQKTSKSACTVLENSLWTEAKLKLALKDVPEWWEEKNVEKKRNSLGPEAHYVICKTRCNVMGWACMTASGTGSVMFLLMMSLLIKVAGWIVRGTGQHSLLRFIPVLEN